ncbi:hypothetical protein QVM48_10225 [Pseudomonas soli]|uniref:hypothetical protein n=1 Tax=Pseudomonas TaxID=286 RepID=UPI000CDBF202|nr:MULTISPECIES: hypothetical protein [Pseudomonas]AUY36322.1 hypothetical protein C3F42_25265 [Pseudomonas sp. PONIH3]MDT3714781.1 hypothetical protein [Pseudomonas soli]MDT3731686.1 hypothetical protein [Pseudomonas soli]
MLVGATGLNWQTVQQPQHNGNEPVTNPAPGFPAITATGKAQTQQHSQGGTSQQHAEDNRKEAFAKMRVSLDNPQTDTASQTRAGKQKASDAAQEFHDYMAKSPAQKIKEKMLQELGLTPEEYDALPPERKMRIDEKIARRVQEEAELKTQAKIEQEQHRVQAANLVGDEPEKATVQDIEQRYSANL